ncbi:uncharacterized protein AMSG_01120 [Thecamonas trahens ATCC 50062]|uniref:Cell division cycle protein 123 n=1 Tax=Thecamonas trahens ATCC 50062 TaxID=461836 RepID=A0A0L0DLL6_THETB|nr:hypothetical protein AMSG_01120 [Thecamonas trahens ATCC 50062]KNC52293.1 hypothetical protein AMSG_01120 [Thecamonas trahens ATCC 50062]|eukprot:XP_013762292.1 hypothetical protein AMSG_01120 [Thecamonas trahens ATCC 50062]
MECTWVVDGVFVTADRDMVNERTSEDAQSVFDVSSPLTSSTSGADARPRCDVCGKPFDGWSAVFAHKGSGENCDPGAGAAGEAEATVTMSARVADEVRDTVHALGRELVESSDGRWSMKYLARSVEFALDQLTYARCNAYNLERWYPAVEAAYDAAGKPLPTARSIFLPLSDPDIDILCKTFSRGEFGSSLSRAESETLAALERRVQAAMDEATLMSTRFFVRLSTRSPKDAVTSQDGTAKDALAVTRAREALALIGRSMRCYSDLQAHLKFRALPNLPAMNLILREWVDMPFDYEFRCFVASGALTAISQYACFDVVPELHDTATLDAIRDAIVELHTSLDPLLSLDSYVFDVVWMPDTGSVSLIEINPFGAELSSGACLFSWTRDRALLYGDEPAAGSQPAVRVLRELIGKASVPRVAPSAMFGV